MQAGVAHAEGNFFIIPGDCPFVKESTFRALLSKSFLIRVPVHDGKTGHPTYFHSSLKDKILKEDVSYNLHDFRDKIGYEKVVVNDPNIHNDVDTIEDYQKLIKTIERKQI